MWHMNQSIKICVRKAVFLLALSLLLSSCFRDKFPVNYTYGHFPQEVTNFEAVNSTYDDYNSAGPPVMNLRFPLIFSSNRDSKGESFDLIDYDVYVSFNQHDGTFSLSAMQFSYPFYYLTELANSDRDEYGPMNSAFANGQFLFCFASNRAQKDNMEIYVSYWDPTTFSGMSPMDPTPFRLEGVNSPKYDAYPSFTSDFFRMIFSSNRDGELDLYTIEVPPADDIPAWIKLSDTTFAATPVEELNSPARDVCPLINGNLIVFASDREGGFGGYDLWYAEVTTEGFGEPVNFGSDINTAHNEYRPLVIYAEIFDNDLLIFSSDRPGGKGGYDLYYVGIDRMTTN